MIGSSTVPTGPQTFQTDGWVIHRHEHNNRPEKFPFVAYDAQRINVSRELLNYRPIALKTQSSILDVCPGGSRIRDVDTARADLGTE